MRSRSGPRRFALTLAASAACAASSFCGAGGHLPVFGYSIEEGRSFGMRVVYMSNNQIGMTQPFRDAFELNAEAWILGDGEIDHYIRFEASSNVVTEAIDVESVALDVDGDLLVLEPASERETESRSLGRQKESRLFRSSADVLRKIAGAERVTAVVAGSKDITREFDGSNRSRFRQWTERFAAGDASELTVVVRAATANVREQPTTDSAVVTQLDRGTRLTCHAKDGEWYAFRLEQLDRGLSGVGWVHASTVQALRD